MLNFILFLTLHLLTYGRTSAELPLEGSLGGDVNVLQQSASGPQSSMNPTLLKISQRLATSNCTLSPDILKEIASYQTAVDKIINYVMEGDHKGVTYDSLTKFVDTFGSRLVSDFQENREIKNTNI